MKLTVSKKEDDIKDTSGGAFINRSGVFPVNLNYVQIATSKNGAKQLNFNVTHQGMEQTIWGPYLTSVKGEINKITNDLLNRLCIIAGMDHDQVIETETVEYPVGREQKLMEMEVIPELCDIPVIMRIQMEYGLWNNDIQERKGVRAFYREDGATAAEATSGVDIGRRLQLDTEKYANNITYNDGLTEEDVKEWIRSRMSNRDTADTAPKAKTSAKRPLFKKAEAS